MAFLIEQVLALHWGSLLGLQKGYQNVNHWGLWIASELAQQMDNQKGILF